MEDDFEELESNMGIFLRELSKHIPANRPKNYGKAVEYECPLCGGTVKCSRAKGSGHVSANCSDCGYGVIE